MQPLLLDTFGGYDIAVSVVAIMITCAGIVLGIGYAMNDKRLKDFGSMEIYQSLINGVIIGTLYFAFSSSGIVTLAINSITSGALAQASCPALATNNTAICFAYDYLVGSSVTIGGVNEPSLLSIATINLLLPLSEASVVLGLASSIQVDVSILTIGLQGALTPFLNQIGYAITALTIAITGIAVQSVLLEFISNVAVPVLLPVGIILRSFYFTRSLGGALIATAIGMYAVFPMTYVLDAQLTSSYVTSTSLAIGPTFLAAASTLKDSLLGVVGGFNFFSGNFINIGAISGAINNAVTSYGTVFNTFMQLVVDAIALMLVEVFFLPTLSIILTIISIRELAELLGSEITFSKFYVI